MSELEAIVCPDCRRSTGSVDYVAEKRGGPPPALSYATCLRKCPSCDIGFSNTRNPNAVVRIYRDPLRNIPEQVRGGALEALAAALNIRNRENKREKFAFETSEDAVTWTVFRYLQLTENVTPVLRECIPGLLSAAPQEPSLLLWGAPVPPSDPRAGAIRQRLEELLLRIGENLESFSEPDVILDLGPAGIVMIEVKYRSLNDTKPADHGGWSRYIDTDAFADPMTLRNGGHYELARNWRIGWELAGERPFTLANLGPAVLFEGSVGKRLTEFERCLQRREGRCFRQLPWPRLLEAIPGWAGWFKDYVASRGLQLSSPGSA
jgi:hypothetical protein